jgi:dihydroorotate dehydrogenase (fumarate)
MDLTTEYLGLTLRTPIVPSASPLSEDVSTIKKLEDAGSAAVVLYSLFEEELVRDQLALNQTLDETSDVSAEALSFFPQSATEFRVGPDQYLNHIRKAKEAVAIPIIASLNGTSAGGWTDYARQIEQAGADALELNIYYIPTNPAADGASIEQTYLDILQAVKRAVSIPVAVKLSPFFSNMASMARRLDEAGANSLVLFNRFYQPDINLEELEVEPNLLLSTPQALRLPLTWIGILHGRIKADLAATGGIHTAHDALKMLMVGANITMVCSALLKNGIGHISTMEKGIRLWMEEHEYESVRQMQGSMSQLKAANPAAFERAQYIKTIKGYKPTLVV